MGEIEAYIRSVAPSFGVDPDIAVRVANSEGGLHDPFRQGEAMLSYGREQSYGPFQLHIRQGGLGTRALAAGIDPRKDWKRGVDYALEEASKRGWGQWYGAAKAGIGNTQGIGGKITPRTTNAGPDGPKGKEAYGPYSLVPGGPVEAAGGGSGSEAGQTAPAGAAPPSAPAKPQSWGSKIADALSEGLSGFSAGGGGVQPIEAPAQPGAVAATAQPRNWMGDTQGTDVRRQQLAMALQRLNAGQLF